MVFQIYQIGSKSGKHWCYIETGQQAQRHIPSRRKKITKIAKVLRGDWLSWGNYVLVNA